VIGQVGLVDIGMLLVLAVSVVVGLVRGLVFELLSLAGWVVAYFAASWFAADVAAALPQGMRDALGATAQRSVAFAVLFFATLIAWTLLARLVRLLLHATPLSLIDRAGGGAFGVLRGTVLLLVLATVVRYTPASQSLLWQTSVGATWLGQLVGVIEPWLPGVVRPAPQAVFGN
jgi:membrane protein required for colicin V production